MPSWVERDSRVSSLAEKVMAVDYCWGKETSLRSGPWFVTYGTRDVPTIICAYWQQLFDLVWWGRSGKEMDRGNEWWLYCINLRNCRLGCYFNLKVFFYSSLDVEILLSAMWSQKFAEFTIIHLHQYFF